MLLSEDGTIGSFCCSDMEKYTLTPNKAIMIDPSWKEFQMDSPEPKACIFLLNSGVAQSTWGTPQPAGATPIAISFCPFCAARIEFE